MREIHEVVRSRFGSTCKRRGCRRQLGEGDNDIVASATTAEPPTQLTARHNTRYHARTQAPARSCAHTRTLARVSIHQNSIP